VRTGNRSGPGLVPDRESGACGGMVRTATTNVKRKDGSLPKDGEAIAHNRPATGWTNICDTFYFLGGGTLEGKGPETRRPDDGSRALGHHGMEWIQRTKQSLRVST
jgi:hypothetical protein